MPFIQSSLENIWGDYAYPLVYLHDTKKFVEQVWRHHDVWIQNEVVIEAILSQHLNRLVICLCISKIRLVTHDVNISSHVADDLQRLIR
jgi:hypothetical protein